MYNAMITTAPKLAERDTQTSQIAVLLMGTRTYTIGEADGNILFGSNTLSPGAPAQTIDGQTVSLGTQGIVVDGSSTFSISGQNTMAAAPAIQGAVIPFANDTVTYTAGAGLVVGGVTLTPGGPAAAASGTTIWLDASGLLVDGTRIALNPLPSAMPTDITAAAFPTITGPGASSNASVSGMANSGGAAAASSVDPVFVQYSGSPTSSAAQSTKTNQGSSAAQSESNGLKVDGGSLGVFVGGMLTSVFTFLLV